MTPFLNELGKKLAEKWLSVLVLPGLLLLATTGVAVRLGHSSALDGRLLVKLVGQWAAAVARWPATGQAAGFAAALLASLAVGALVRAAADAVLRPIWFGNWPRPLATRATNRRAKRWRGLQGRLGELRAEAPPDSRSTELLHRLDRLSARRDRIALAAPSRPTFTGDRLAGTAARVRNQYGVDLASCWMRFWVVLPEDVRAELRTARQRLDDAIRRSTWAAAYLLPACAWWPAALPALVVGCAAWVQGRRAAVDHADLVESVVDVHVHELASELRLLDGDQRVDPETGAWLTRIARKGA
ncbi:hypothetical protein [Saccharothrix xinjiangensis]|uniref:Vegetative cell wall protein gp1 n=1 Tax=Saccharothrix xinjiangensis TaxID=204798 RepID=A0ABV9YIK0_9PSEU